MDTREAIRTRFMHMYACERVERIIDKAVAKFARAYADQNEQDYRRFMAALDAGELA